MKKKYIAPEILLIVAESGNLLQASNNVASTGPGGTFDPDKNGELIKPGDDESGSTPAKEHPGGFYDWDSDWEDY